MGRPRLIILIRHGESESNLDKSVNQITPNHKISLTEKGHRQALEAGKRLCSILGDDDNVLFFTSPYKRAKQTTEGIIKELDKRNVEYRVTEEPRLREQDFGNFQGGDDEMRKIWKDRSKYGHFFYRIPNGESAADVYDRCAGFNETLFRQFQSDKFPEVLVLVTHGIFARVFLMKWYRWSYEKYEMLKNINHCQFLIMERNEDNHKYSLKTRLRTWDDNEFDNGDMYDLQKAANAAGSKVVFDDEEEKQNCIEVDEKLKQDVIRRRTNSFPKLQDRMTGLTPVTGLSGNPDLTKSDAELDTKVP